MPAINVTVQHEVGLHARPASIFVKKASQYKSAISVSCNGRSANAKSILSVLTLGAHKGTEIEITAAGEDADEALTALKELIDNNFGEQ